MGARKLGELIVDHVDSSPSEKPENQECCRQKIYVSVQSVRQRANPTFLSLVVLVCLQ